MRRAPAAARAAGHRWTPRTRAARTGAPQCPSPVPPGPPRQRYCLLPLSRVPYAHPRNASRAYRSNKDKARAAAWWHGSFSERGRANSAEELHAQNLVPIAPPLSQASGVPEAVTAVKSAPQSLTLGNMVFVAVLGRGNFGKVNTRETRRAGWR